MKGVQEEGTAGSHVPLKYHLQLPQPFLTSPWRWALPRL